MYTLYIKLRLDLTTIKFSLNAEAKIVLFDGPSNLGNIRKAYHFWLRRSLITPKHYYSDSSQG